MKIEFQIDFHLRPVFKAVFPKIAGAFKGLRFKADGLRRQKRFVLFVLSGIVALVLLLILLIKLV
jgi:hypothetical protein